MPKLSGFYANFPIRPARRAGTVPIVYVRAKDVASGKTVRVPVSLGIRFPGDRNKYPSACQPIGFERSIMLDLSGNWRTFKGAGERDPGNRYFHRIGIRSASLNPEVLAPFAVNENPTMPTHVLLGGGEQAILQYEFAQTRKLIEMVRKLGVPLGGLPNPIAVYRLLEIPVITPDGKVTLVRPKDFFEARVVPTVYEYEGRMGPRVGNTYEIISNATGMLRDLLIEKGRIDEKKILDASGGRKKNNGKGLFGNLSPTDPKAGLEDASNEDIKKVIDELIRDFYLSAGINIRLPQNTELDLHSLDGRIAYLKEIRKLNNKAAAALTRRFAGEIAKQLGIIHGSGGHVGGGSDVGSGGFLLLHFRDKDGKFYELSARFSREGQGKISRSIRWVGKRPQTSAPYNFDGLKLTKIEDVGYEDFEEIGPCGGGSTRSDNVGVFGMRDFDTLALGAKDSQLDSLLRLLPPQLTASRRMRAYLKYYYLMMKQEIDILNLFCVKGRFEFKPFPGTFMHFVALTGGEAEDYYSLKVKFQNEYSKWRNRAFMKLAPLWFRRIDNLRLGSRLAVDFGFLRIEAARKENETVKEFFPGEKKTEAQAPSSRAKRRGDNCMDYVERLAAIGYY